MARARQALATGDLVQAAPIVDGLLALESQDGEALHLGGVVALRQGRTELAISRLRRAATLNPRDPAVLIDFGLALEAGGKRADAEMVYRAALMMAPNHAEALDNLARLLMLLARDGDAAETYQRLLALNPHLSHAWYNLARLQLQLRQPLKALESARKVIAIDPRHMGGASLEADVLDVLGRPDEALAAARRAIALDPEAAAGYFNLANIELHYGRIAEAATDYREAIRREPERGEFYRSLSFVVSHREADEDIETMRRLERSNSTSDEDRMHLCFGLGKALEDVAAFDEAFAYFLKGNRLKRARLNYANAEADRVFDTIKAAFTAERFAALKGAGSPDRTPIFVLGMPRSSTSLVEQILASHPDVQGGGEFRIISQLVGSIAGGPGFPIAEALDSITPEELRGLGERYVAQVRGLSDTARFITDKLPGNFLMVGMIKLILPNARIIHCRRDPVDNCLSIFKNYFAADHLRYAYDLGEIGHYYTRYLDLMEHWRRVLPGFVYDVNYAELVGDFDNTAQRLVEACGLDWREECRNYFNTRRPVDTASAVQVRKPIYKSSMGQRDRYGDRLKPLLDALPH